MTDRNFDPSIWLDAYRDSFASVQKAQEQSFKTFERLARFQYAVSGDYLDAGIAFTQSALGVKNPAELIAKQTELSTSLGEKLRARAQEFASIASEVQGSVANFATETVKGAKKAA